MIVPTKELAYYIHKTIFRDDATCEAVAEATGCTEEEASEALSRYLAAAEKFVPCSCENCTGIPERTAADVQAAANEEEED
ncbi:hypothetical protein C1Y63_10515 [Corynebacterium sp. 13CS0277]|uniref:hypothetical protein n=1 Tax=Corynebacterium sp. 13CS0277 TaxID=2071994 RepID=UPI000D0267EE|nr:hypothetical protein [Corynebacterium sp. 13CS0277]PRQ10619.1 hypothetical protein C1Y63_10515 [Corynebacterium sp. 13CS0277]